MSNVTFPQPMVEAPRYQSEYFFAHKGEVCGDKWGTEISKGGHKSELAALARGEIYETAEACAQRIAYDAQEMARLVIPAWFRKLGPDVEVCPDGDKWLPLSDYFPITDYSKIEPKYYRAKPRDVVVTVIVNGVSSEFRWPATVTENEPEGDRHIVRKDGGLEHWLYKFKFYGPRVHHTRNGAETQLAAIRAVGESL